MRLTERPTTHPLGVDSASGPACTSTWLAARRRQTVHRGHFPSRLIPLLVSTLLCLTACTPGTASPLPTPDHLPTATATVEPTPTATPSYEDVYEPNDSMLQASGPLVPGQAYLGYISDKNDLDFFYLEIDSPQIVKLGLTDMPPDADYDLYLVTGEEDLLAESASSGQADEHIEYTTSSVGVFYVLVLPFHNFSSTEPYTLQLELLPVPTPSGEDNYEPNDSFDVATGPLAFAQPLRSYIWDEGDVDLYFFQVDQRSEIAIMLTEIPSVAHYGIMLYDGAGNLVTSATRALSYAAIQTSLDPGTYYVAVQSFSGFSTEEPYALEISSVAP
jgi:hypothetical protein